MSVKILRFGVLLVLATAVSARAAESQGSLSGNVLDPLGARVPGAAVQLLRDGNAVASATSDGEGRYSFAGVEEGRYTLEASASGFTPQATRPFFVGGGARASVDVSLQIGLHQEVVVSATATEVPASQVAAPVTVINRQALDDLGKSSVLEALRLVPGSQVVQTAGRGGATALFVRGGNSNFNKVLVDGIAVNDIGGGFDYSALQATGIERVEALRDANSVLYGSDAVAGVVSITTRRGSSRAPELSGAVDGGNLGTHREEVSLGGTARRFDYFGAYSHFATDNDVPNNAYANDTFAGRVGWALGSASDLSATFRRTTTDYGVPNAVDLFGISDDSSQRNAATYFGLGAQSQFSPAWSGVARLLSYDESYDIVNPAPTGTPFDPFGFGANYLGEQLTVRGANRTSATGRAILDFSGVYPQTFPRESERSAAAAQMTYQALPALAVSAGGRFDHEEGSAGSSATERDNYGAFLEARVKARRLHASAGLGYDHNAVFLSAWTPRLSAAFYLREPSGTAALGDTKLSFNLGRGIKAPGIAQELSSLYGLLQSSPGVGTQVTPIGPERGRSLDGGLEQGFARGKARVRASYFDNEYSDLIEFLSKTALTQLGVPPAVVNATAFGAYVNAASYRARGLEASAEAALGAFRLAGSYTYLDAEVTESFASSALAPAINPAYPNVPIGAFSPLVGARPFRRPTHLGNAQIAFARGPAQLMLVGYFAGKSDDSTFLSDAFFGNSMLLPNRDLNGGYQKLDLSGSLRLLRSRVKLYFSAENLLDQRYTPSFGFPALPFTIRAGIGGTLGGDGPRKP